MAQLVSPGVSVTVNDDSFFIPSAAPTVPLFFIATEEDRFQADGITTAPGTFEHSIIRTVTSLRQSQELYGVPRFLRDASDNPHHGDARNEYGLFALNQFLSQGSLAYVVRVNVNLNDDINYIRDLWDRKITEASFALENAVNILIQETNAISSKFPGDGPCAGYQEVLFGTVGSPSIPIPKALTDLAGWIPMVSGSPALPVPVTATITIDGIGVPISYSPVLGTETIQDVLNILNIQLAGAGTATLVLGKIHIESATTGLTSSVFIVDGTTNPFFGTLTDFSGFAAPVGGLNGYKETVTVAEYISLVNQVMTDIVYTSYTFRTVENDFEDDHTALPLPIFENGFDFPSTGGFLGVAGDAAAFAAALLGSNPSFPDEFTPQDASDTLVSSADDFKFTQEFANNTSLGANDAARRTAITVAFQAEINSNLDIRSENFEFNLVLTPGYWETVDEMLSLVVGVDVKEEALIIADTPSTFTPAEVVAWAGTTARQTSEHIAYYYPWQLASNLDGFNVLAAPSGTALRVYSFSDNVAFLWFAPAGTRRGLVVGVTDLGIASGTLGEPTEFVQVYTNQGQRDDLYKYFTNINPIVFFPGRGILVWGQKTVAPNASAVDRVNVSRLISYIRRQLRKNTLSFVFEPNDQLTRDNLKAVVDAFLSDILVKRGLFDFATISDETNNTPDRIDRNEMYIDVALKPVRAAEFIFIPIRIVATGATI